MAERQNDVAVPHRPAAPGEASPPIASVTWGRLEIAQGRVFRDAKLYPGGAREWDWNETGTTHDPGVQPADVQEILDLGVEVLVIGRGHQGRLRICPETLALLEERGVTVHARQTAVAVELYNRLRERTRVGGVFHTTC
jgi:hypothetical protein